MWNTYHNMWLDTVATAGIFFCWEIREKTVTKVLAQYEQVRERCSPFKTSAKRCFPVLPQLHYCLQGRVWFEEKLLLNSLKNTYLLFSNLAFLFGRNISKYLWFSANSANSACLVSNKNLFITNEHSHQGRVLSMRSEHKDVLLLAHLLEIQTFYKTICKQNQRRWLWDQVVTLEQAPQHRAKPSTNLQSFQ